MPGTTMQASIDPLPHSTKREAARLDSATPLENQNPLATTAVERSLGSYTSTRPEGRPLQQGQGGRPP